jgi:hypothetical protein
VKTAANAIRASLRLIETLPVADKWNLPFTDMNFLFSCGMKATASATGLILRLTK